MTVNSKLKNYLIANNNKFKVVLIVIEFRLKYKNLLIAFEYFMLAMFTSFDVNC